MPEVYLNGDTTRTSAAVKLLHEALFDPAYLPKRVVVMQTDSTNDSYAALEARYYTIDRIFADPLHGERDGINTGHIVIRPHQGLDVRIRTHTLRHLTGNMPAMYYPASIEHVGDFLHIVSPYYFYEDRHMVSFRKWSFFLNCPQGNQE